MTQRRPYGEQGWSGRSPSGSRAARSRDTQAFGGVPGHSGARRSGWGPIWHPSYLIFAVWLVVSTVIGAATAAILHSHSQPVALAGSPIFTAPAPKYLVLFVLDGARPDYFGLTLLPHVDALRTTGTQFTNAMDGILEAETPSGHTTIATGSSPARDGILGFDWAVNDNDYSLFSPDVVRAGAMEHIMEASGVPTIAGLYKAKYPKARVVALSGHKYYAADPLGGPRADAIMYYQGDPKGRYIPVSIPGHSPPANVLSDPALIYPDSHHVPLGEEDTLATDLAIRTFRAMHQRMLLINYPEFDWPLGHVDGGNLAPADVITLMKNFDQDLGRIEGTYRKAGILDKTLFVITADHGMSPVTRFIPSSVVTNAVAQAGTTAPAISPSTGEYVWLADATKAQAVAQNIVKANDPGIQAVYSLSTSSGGHPAEGSDVAQAGRQYLLAGGSFVSPEVEAAQQYLLNTLMNGHQPNVVSFAREGQTFQASSTNWKADHGGPSWQSQHVPLIFAGPGIKSGVVSGASAQLEDIAPTLLTDMGVVPTGMEGQILTEALLHNQGRRVQVSRTAEITRLTPFVNALTAQDDYESAHSPAYVGTVPTATVTPVPVTPTPGTTPTNRTPATPAATGTTTPK